MTASVEDEALDLMNSLHAAVQLPGPGGNVDRLKGWTIGLCVPWAMRAVESALGVATLRASGLGATTQPLNRLVMELSASVHWLIEADDRLAALAVEAERIRNLQKRNTRMIEFGVDHEVEVGLRRQIDERTTELAQVESSLTEAELTVYRGRVGQFRNFEQLLREAGIANWYVLFEQCSMGTHRSAEARKNYVNIGEDDLLSLSSTPSNQTVLALPFVVSLAAAAVGKLQGYVDIFHPDVAAAIDAIEQWYESLVATADGAELVHFESIRALG
jgi:hypothetical protein